MSTTILVVLSSFLLGSAIGYFYGYADGGMK